ncbi:hypothetical protein COBT_002701 [Conglomerata obtusa]
MKFLVFIFLYAFEYIKASKLNLADALNAINEYEAKYGRNVLGPCGLVGENLISEHVKFHDSTSSANYYILVCCELILKREVKSKDDYDCDKIKDKVDHKNVANIWLQFLQEYDGTMIDWTIFEWLHIYDKNILDSMNEDQKQKITDDQTCGLNYLNKKKIISNNELIKFNHLYATRRAYSQPTHNDFYNFKKFEEDLNNFNANNKKNNFSNIVNYCVNVFDPNKCDGIQNFKSYLCPNLFKEKEYSQTPRNVDTAKKSKTTAPTIDGESSKKLQGTKSVSCIPKLDDLDIYLRIALIKEKKVCSPKKLIIFHVSEISLPVNYVYDHIETDYENVFSVTNYEKIILDLIKKIYNNIKENNKRLELISFEQTEYALRIPFPADYPNYKVVENIYCEGIITRNLRFCLNDCALDFKILI